MIQNFLKWHFGIVHRGHFWVLNLHHDSHRKFLSLTVRQAVSVLLNILFKRKENHAVFCLLFCISNWYNSWVKWKAYSAGACIWILFRISLIILALFTYRHIHGGTSEKVWNLYNVRNRKWLVFLRFIDIWLSLTLEYSDYLVGLWKHNWLQTHFFPFVFFSCITTKFGKKMQASRN